MMLQKNIELPKGFSLIEVVVAMGIFLIIVYLASAMFYSYSNPAAIIQAKAFVNSQARRVTERLSWELMQASTVRTFINESGRRIRFALPVEYPNGTLKYSLSGGLLWGDRHTEGNFIEYFWNNTTGIITRQILDANLTLVNGSGITLAQNLTNFCANLSFPVYEFNLTVSVQSYMGALLRFPATYSGNFSVTPQN